MCYNIGMRGAVYASDFVDAGWPSTYNMTDADYSELLEHLIVCSPKSLDFIVVELGGDLLEGRAQDAINFASRVGGNFVLCVNDAMGAICGMEMLRKAGITGIAIASFRQNSEALSRRLQLPAVIDITLSHEELRTELLDKLDMPNPVRLGQHRRDNAELISPCIR